MEESNIQPVNMITEKDLTGRWGTLRQTAAEPRIESMTNGSNRDCSGFHEALGKCTGPGQALAIIV